MNRYTLQWIAARMSERLPQTVTADSAAFAEAFFKTISDGLSSDGVVQISGFGVFTHKDGELSFMPDAPFADAVNLPFAYFEPVAVDDDDLADSLDLINTQEIHSEPQSEPETDNGSECEPEIIQERIMPVTEPENLASEPADTAENQGPDSDDIPEQPQEYSYHEPEEPEYDTNGENHIVFPWSWVIIALLFGCGLGYIIGSNYPYYERWTPENAIEEEAETDAEILLTEDSVVHMSENLSEDDTAVAELATDVPEERPVTETEQKTEQTVVYDTVTSRRYLTTISRHHYGSPEFWPYIYLENRNKLGHPDRVPPSTVVIIPAPSKYGIDSSNPQSIAAAKREGVRIYEEFKRK